MLQGMDRAYMLKTTGRMPRWKRKAGIGLEEIGGDQNDDG